METGLLVLESILLVATIILLLYSIREGKERKGLLLEIGKATRILTRQEYFLTVIDSMMDANKEIVGCITGRLPAGDDKKRVRDVTEAIERLTQKGIRVRYLLPKFPDRLHIGYLYTKAGAEVIYSSCLMVHNIRFIIVDENVVVIGIPESIGAKKKKKKGYRIPSEGLAMILKDYFEQCEKHIGYVEFLKEVMHQTGTTPKLLARELQIDEEELEKLAG
ncbi:MAG: hypothetical protein HY758_06010 [Nitrospirae bacterium]|nr:hypothetical protein [Nitrospirota bacterium]